MTMTIARCCEAGTHEVMNIPRPGKGLLTFVTQTHEITTLEKNLRMSKECDCPYTFQDQLV